MGDGQSFVCHLHQQRFGYRQRKGQTNDETAAAPPLGKDLQRTVQLFDLADHRIHAHTATGHLGDFRRGGESRLQDELVERILIHFRVCFQHAVGHRFLADRVTVQACTVIGDGQHHFRTFPGQDQRDSAGFRLAVFGSKLRRLDTVGHGIAQQMLQQPHDAIQYGTVDLAFCALHIEFGLLAQVLCRLANHALQPGSLTIERHHAAAQQSILEVIGNPRLLLHQRIGITGLITQCFTDVGKVIDGFRQCTGQLLQRGILVHFQGIEVMVTLAVALPFMARADLGFGFQLQGTQLFAQPRDGFVELLQITLNRLVVLFEPGAVNTHLTSIVYHLVEQFR